MKYFCLAVALLSIRFFSACTTNEPKIVTAICDTTKCADERLTYKSEGTSAAFLELDIKNCTLDTAFWGSKSYKKDSKIILSENFERKLYIDKQNFEALVGDGTSIWLKFNDCVTTRGYLIGLPLSEEGTIKKYSSAINNTDKKFNIDKSLIAYTDRGNIFVEEWATGKQATMTFGERIEIDYDFIHETVDSVFVTPTKIWAKVMMNKQWKEFEKEITLK